MRVLWCKNNHLLEVTLLGNIKYKVNELAKDLGLQTKDIVEILGKYFDTPKKSGQNLEEEELNVIFEYLTQNNQISGIEVIFAEAAAAEAKANEAKTEVKAEAKAQQPKAAAPAAKPQQSQNAPKSETAPAAKQDEDQEAASRVVPKT